MTGLTETTVETAPLLEARNLRIEFGEPGSTYPVVDGVSLRIAPGRTLGLVGESGSGKSMTALSLIDLLPRGGRRAAGTVTWRGVPADAQNLRAIRGRQVTMIFQDAMASLNPLLPVGVQLREVLRAHRGMTRRQAGDAAVDLFEQVGIPQPRERLRQLPGQLSGGMQQRVMIALALAPRPDLLIADEPTTALDVTIQAQILDLLATVQEQHGLAVLLISHDLGVVAGVADDLAVMYAGRIIEQGPVDEVFRSPRHPYTRGLLRATPRPDGDVEDLEAIQGSPPMQMHTIKGCAFAPRCPDRFDRCDQRPDLLDVAPGRRAACWLVEEPG